jgi:hypothetical protein
MLSFLTLFLLFLGSLSHAFCGELHQRTKVQMIRAAYNEAKRNCPVFDMRIHRSYAGTKIGGWTKYKDNDASVEFNHALASCIANNLCEKVYSVRQAEVLLNTANKKCKGTPEDLSSDGLLGVVAEDDLATIEQESEQERYVDDISTQNFGVTIAYGTLLAFSFGSVFGGTVTFFLHQTDESVTDGHYRER